ncbi:hypothetical protein [Gryllotalpicola protaetiae]|uniref:Uncharacterized protein n=1 Tax=Gryllotalpicola protaetiae TaxID=2419771 RepID=A0A387BMU4_9MICO|nr:hypothetical protein [Gryllotalpicola protaetiae]AYG03344.1 hypothetical protein D7I44_07240 [Gryllotalpicola protaetiae]
MNTVKENVRKATAALDDTLVPLIGPAIRGPYGVDERREDPHPGVTDGLCPVCYHAISRHDVDVDAHTHHTYLVCPDLGTALGVERHPHEAGTLDHAVLT